MLRILIALALLISVNFSFAQNTFPENGNVGIGTTTPDAQLHVQNTTQAWIDFKVKTLRTIDGRGVNNYFLDGNDDGWNMIFAGHRSGQPLRFMPISQGTAGNATMSLLDNGYIGIGTDAPNESLHVNGNIALENLKYIKFYDNSGVDDGTSIVRYGGNAMRIRYKTAHLNFDALSDDPVQINDSNGDTKIKFHPNGLTYFNGGNVAIGTTSAQGYLLAVAGKIVAEEIVVKLEANWPDYVFNSDYKLGSLEQVKKHIDENGHLPNMPSAADVNENGISLGEMNRLLLEKVEELTLYMLEQNDQLKAQQNQILVLTEEVQNLKK